MKRVGNERDKWIDRQRTRDKLREKKERGGEREGGGGTMIIEKEKEGE